MDERVVEVVGVLGLVIRIGSGGRVWGLSVWRETVYSGETARLFEYMYTYQIVVIPDSRCSVCPDDLLILNVCKFIF